MLENQQSISQKFAERFSLYKFTEPVLNYKCNEFVALTTLCETGALLC